MLKPIAIVISAAAVGLSAPVIGVLPGDSEVNVTWKLPSANIDYVVVEQSTNGGATWSKVDTIPGNATHLLVDGLKNGTSYWFRVHWMVRGIPSTQSQALLAIPYGAPPAPRNVEAVGGDSQASLMWDKPDAASKVRSYAVQASSDGGDTWKLIDKDTGGPATSYLVDGLTNGTTYSFRVAAININNIGSDWSDAASAIIGVMKDDSFELNSEIVGSQVNLDWTEPDLKAAIDTYRIEISTDGGMTWSTAQEVDADTNKISLTYVLGGALYRVVATSITSETALSVVSLVQTLEDQQDSPIDIVGDGSGTSGSGSTNSNSGTGVNGSGGASGTGGDSGTGAASADAVTTDVNGGVGTRETLPEFDPVSAPEKAVNTFVAGLAMLGVLSGGAGVALARRDDQVANLDNINFNDLESIDGFEEAGDRSRTWRIPNVAWTLRVEKITHAIASHFNRFSPLFSRALSDGAYLRAMYGSLALFTWIAAIGLGILTIIETGGQALPPKPLTVILILLLSTLDAGAGLLATVVVMLGTAAFGGFDSIPAIRTTLGLAILWISPALIASSARPIRRSVPNFDDIEDENVAARERQNYSWERMTDFVIAPALTGLAVNSMINGLPALAGLKLPIVNSSLIIVLLSISAVLTRIGLEDSASKNYPIRLAWVEQNEMRTPLKGQSQVSKIIQVLLFTFVAIPYMGMSWQLYAGAAMFIAPSLLEYLKGSLPKFPALYQILPVGVPKFAMMLYIGAAYSAFVANKLEGADAIRMGFVLLPIPGLILSILHLFEGNVPEGTKRWYMQDKFKWVYRIGGVILVLTSAYTILK